MLLPKGLVKEYAKILIVDDQQTNRVIARDLFTQAGFKHFEEAETGVEALDKVASFKPHLILADVVMHEMDGFEMCRHLKENPKTADIPILFVTGLEDDENRTVGYKLGAVDYVNKPLRKEEMLARAEVHIHNGMLNHELQSYYNRVSAELHRARVLQQGLLPTAEELDVINSKNKLHISGFFQACTELAGDYWQVYELGQNKLGIILVDFTGHGVAAALNTATIHALLMEMEDFMQTPIELMYALNKRLLKLLTVDSFATCFYGVLDTESGAFEYASCGAEAPLSITKKGKLKALPNKGIPLGLTDETFFKPSHHTIKLEAGDTLMLFSDALAEAKHDDESRWLETGIHDAIKRCIKSKIPDLVEGVMKQFNKTVSTPIHDDLTLITIKLAD